MTAQQQARDLFDQFIAIHPNSNEQFTPTLENLQRWAWHIRESGNRPTGEEVRFSDNEDARKIAKSRSFTQFVQMPAYMKDKYLQISGLFPGIQFYACGSRVNGEYVDQWSGDAIQRLRVKLGKPVKMESDYDVCIEIKPGMNLEQIKEQLPPWADLLNYGVPDDEKIPIPMWDFTRLPEEEHANVIALFNAQRWGELMIIHNKYVLSMNVYCCNEAPIIRYFSWAIENGIIKSDDTQTETLGMDQ